MNIDVEGRSVHALVKRGKDRGALLLVHGAGADHRTWLPIISAMPDLHCDVIAPDLPGHGRSGGAPLNDINDMAAFIQGLAEATGAGAVAGHSMGALVALATAARAGRALQQVILLGIAVPMAVNEALLRDAAAADPAAVDTILHYGLAENAGGSAEECRESLREIFSAAHPGVLHSDLAACDQFRDGLALAAAIRCPVTLILGEEDRLTPPANALPLIETLNDPRVERIPRCGHMIPCEQPRQAAQIIAGHLQAP